MYSFSFFYFEFSFFVFEFLWPNRSSCRKAVGSNQSLNTFKLADPKHHPAVVVGTAF